MKYFMCLLVVSLLVGCESWVDFSEEKTKIVALYYIQKGRYTVAIQRGNSFVMKEIPRVSLFNDATDYPWYECDYKYEQWKGSEVGGCYVHIRSINDISTAGWDLGKFGSGDTVRVD